MNLILVPQMCQWIENLWVSDHCFRLDSDNCVFKALFQAYICADQTVTGENI